LSIRDLYLSQIFCIKDSDEHPGVDVIKLFLSVTYGFSYLG